MTFYMKYYNEPEKMLYVFLLFIAISIGVFAFVKGGYYYLLLIVDILLIYKAFDIRGSLKRKEKRNQSSDIGEDLSEILVRDSIIGSTDSFVLDDE